MPAVEWNQRENSVNLISQSFIEDLRLLIGELKKIKAFVFLSSKKEHFCAGADLKEITGEGLDQKIEAVHECFNEFESLEIPKIIAIEGLCLGGGLEWALCFDKILISDSAQLAFPEVQLGLLPGAGGCVRTAKKIGLAKAIPLITKGSKIQSEKAFQIGLADEKVPPLLLKKRAMELAQELSGKKNIKISYQKKHPFLYHLESFIKPGLGLIAKKQILKKTKGFYPAPLKALEVLKAYRSQSALKKEKSAFIHLWQTKESQNLIRLFFLTEQNKKKLKTSFQKDKSLDQKSSPLNKNSFHSTAEIQKVAVFGAGVMGSSIASLLVDKNFEVRLIDPQEKALCSALSKIESHLDKKYRSYQREQKKSRLSVSQNLWGLKKMDLVIEAVNESLPIKQNLIDSVSKQLSPDCFFASNSSSLSILEMSKSSHKADHFFGLHFFNPAHRMPLVEVCLTEKQKQNPSILNFLKKIGKTPVFVKDSPGFIVNRILLSFIMESLFLFEEGWPIKRLDSIFTKELGFPLGPFELMNHVGIELCLQVQSNLEQAGLSIKKPDFFTDLPEKLKEGLNNKRIINKELKKTAVLDKQKMISRVMNQINQTAKELIEKKISTAEDIDLAMVLGAGFPAFLGGPTQKTSSLLQNKLL